MSQLKCMNRALNLGQWRHVLGLMRTYLSSQCGRTNEIKRLVTDSSGEDGAHRRILDRGLRASLALSASTTPGHRPTWHSVMANFCQQGVPAPSSSCDDVLDAVVVAVGSVCFAKGSSSQASIHRVACADVLVHAYYAQQQKQATAAPSMWTAALRAVLSERTPTNLRHTILIRGLVSALGGDDVSTSKTVIQCLTQHLKDDVSSAAPHYEAAMLHILIKSVAAAAGKGSTLPPSCVFSRIAGEIPTSAPLLATYRSTPFGARWAIAMDMFHGIGCKTGYSYELAHAVSLLCNNDAHRDLLPHHVAASDVNTIAFGTRFDDAVAAVNRAFDEGKVLPRAIIDNVVNISADSATAPVTTLRFRMWSRQQSQSYRSYTLQYLLQTGIWPMLVQQRCVSVDGRVTTQMTFVMKPGQVVEVRLPGVGSIQQRHPLNILYLDDDIGLISKSANVPTTVPVIHIMMHGVPDVRSSWAPYVRDVATVRRSGVVHRIDKGTTGALVLARTQRACTHLRAQNMDDAREKTYLALCVRHGASSGRFFSSTGYAELIDKDVQLSEVLGTRDARTHVRVVEMFGGAVSMALVECKLVGSGRRHQIRQHLASVGMPILGDDEYGGGSTATPFLDRPALHAHRLSVRHPATGDGMVFEITLPQDMHRVLEWLRRDKLQRTQKL
eukprot:PhM_4_TR15989/c0_g1_i1/m.31892/K06180/rluD; 23S rRNA pseudouridine1911/1915/1917 synthase